MAVEPGLDATGHAYLAIYEVEAEQPQDALDRLGKAIGGGMTLSEAIDLANVSVALYSPLGERVG